MFVPKKGRAYYSDDTVLLIEILNVYYVSNQKDYVKVKYRLSNRLNNIYYQTRAAKLDLKRIQHWKNYVK